MTRLYDKHTDQVICELPSAIVGFSIKESDVLNIDGDKYKVCGIEHFMEKSIYKNCPPRYIERKVTATRLGTHVLQ